MPYHEIDCSYCVTPEYFVEIRVRDIWGYGNGVKSERAGLERGLSSRVNECMNKPLYILILIHDKRDYS
jgi:hypothetical protein